MTRYIVLPTLVVFALGLGAGWALRGGRSTPRDVWDDAGWWSKGFGDGLKVRGLTMEDVNRIPSPGPSLDEVLACHSRLDRCLEANLAAAKSAAAPSTRRKRTGASRVDAYTLCPRRLSWDGSVRSTDPEILVPCEAWEKDQDANR